MSPHQRRRFWREFKADLPMVALFLFVFALTVGVLSQTGWAP